jgi:hypothetical protein
VLLLAHPKAPKAAITFSTTDNNIEHAVMLRRGGLPVTTSEDDERVIVPCWLIATACFFLDSLVIGSVALDVCTAEPGTLWILIG